MGTIRKWTKEKIQTEALKYTYRTEFMHGSAGAYKAAVRLGILDGVCTQMIAKSRTWTDDEIYTEALKYNNRSDFSANSSGYAAAHSEHKVFNRADVFEMESQADIDVAELYLINLYTPQYNLDSNTGTPLKLRVSNLDDVITKKTTYIEEEVRGDK